MDDTRGALETISLADGRATTTESWYSEGESSDAGNQGPTRGSLPA